MATRDLTTADLAGAGDRAETQPKIELGIEEPADSVVRTDAPSSADPTAPLFEAEETERFRAEWLEVQSGFVDQPRESVERADGLVAEVMQRLATQFAEGRAALERGWDGNADVSTEDLRVTMTRYRSFFERLLNA